MNKDQKQKIRELILSKNGKEYLLRELKRTFPLKNGTLCGSEYETFYNLGKFESYLEILLDLREACSDKDLEARKGISEILLAWFFDGEIMEEI